MKQPSSQHTTVRNLSRAEARLRMEGLLNGRALKMVKSTRQFASVLIVTSLLVRFLVELPQGEVLPWNTLVFSSGAVLFFLASVFFPSLTLWTLCRERTKVG